MSGGGEEKRKRIAIIGFSTLLLVAMIVVVIMGISNETEFNDDNDDDIEDNQKHVASTMKAVKTLCYPTDYKKECEENLMPAAGNNTDPKELVKIAFNVVISKIGDKLKQTEILHELENEPRAKLALETCKQLMDLSIDEFLRSLDQIKEFDLLNVDEIFTSVKVWLSGAVTYQDTCLDGFENTTSEASKKMKDLLTTSMHMSSNALAIITNMADTIADWNVTRLLGGRRLLEESKNENSFNLPTWVDDDAGVHKLLAETPFKIKPNVTVALDGTGDFKSINKALKKVPSENEKPFVIYIKKGIYHEYVHVTKDMTNVVFVGDGGDKTRITGNKNFIDGVNTYNTTTVGGSIVADPMLQAAKLDHKSYLARPWKNFSRTIFMDTFIDGFIDPEGFLAWQGEEGPMHMNTCFYSEYHNYGPGSDKSKRAHWAGIWNLNSKAAHLFQPSKFFHGGDWIEDTGIPYYPGIPKHYRHKMTVRNWLPEKEDKEDKKN
ncbi:unnamed protein product [Lupinus luteus]|uniref:Pectinesterase inhibitor domain-containing protein n=1 Tax=Lupinus luteus TaxID=3873 RepID=A0AAV1XGZ6_LUPLU